jgi:hypothetical protein
MKDSKIFIIERIAITSIRISLKGNINLYYRNKNYEELVINFL